MSTNLDEILQGYVVVLNTAVVVYCIRTVKDIIKLLSRHSFRSANRKS